MRRCSLTTAIVALSMSCFAMSGCGGGAKPGKDTNTASNENIDPFGVGSVDLREGGTAEGESGESDYDPEDLQVPGAEYGTKKSGAKASKVKCPKGKEGKKCREAAKKAAAPIPESDQISGQMEGIPWGLHYQAAIANFEKRIRKSYEEQFKNASGAVEEDEVRTRMMREINKLKKSYLEFNGERTGYEGAVLDTEFTHNNGEAMIEWDAGKFVEYLFFFNGRFWKRLRTFRKEALNIPDFESYIATLDKTFGEGKRYYNEKGELDEVRWQNKDTYMTAKDKSSFYGVFCLYFTAKVTEDNLAKLRPNADRDDGRVKEEISGMVKAVTGGELADHDSSVVDAYTGSQVGGGVTIDRGDSIMSKQPGGDEKGEPAKKDAKKGAKKKDSGAGSNKEADIF